MAINFPTNPTDGQVYSGYYYDLAKTAWRSLPIEQAQSISSSTPPLTANPGEFWFNTNDGVLFTYLSDGTSSQWVEVKANSTLNSTIPPRLDSLESSTARLTGGNSFTGTQTFSGNIITPNRPYFLSQAVINDASYAVGTVLPYPNVIYNAGGNYSTATNRFTAPVTGLYYFNFSAWHTSGTTRVGIRKNGAYITSGTQSQPIHARMGSTSSDQDSNLSIIINMNSGDYVDVCVYEGTAWMFFAQHFMGYLIG